MEFSTSRCFSGEDHVVVRLVIGALLVVRYASILIAHACCALPSQWLCYIVTDSMAQGVCDILLIHHPLLQVSARTPPCNQVCRTPSPASLTRTRMSDTPSRACTRTWQWHAPTACSMLTCTRPLVRRTVRHLLRMRRAPMAHSFRLGRDVTVGAGVRGLRRALPYRFSTFVR